MRGEVAPCRDEHMATTVGPRRRIPVGQHTVEFSDVAGWTKPGNQAVTINKGQTTSATGTYVQQLGSLR